MPMDAKIAHEANKRRQARPFGAPEPVTNANNIPTVTLPEIPTNAMAAFHGRVRIVKSRLTRSPQTPEPPSVRLVTLVQPSTLERRTVGAHEAKDLLSHGWHIAGGQVVDVRTVTKKQGKL